MSNLYSIALLLAFAMTCYSAKIPTNKLLDGHEIPFIGFGTANMITVEQVDAAITAALEIGYRHIDTAFLYVNEKNIGRALKKWFAKGGNREDLFITSKLPLHTLRPSDVSTALDMSLNDLGLDYIDMYMIHHPFGLQRTVDYKILYDENKSILDYSTDHVAIWKEMEKLVKSGKVKSIGLSNFNKTQVSRVWKTAEIKPSNLQIELNAYIQQQDLVNFCQKKGIIVTGFSPLGSNRQPDDASIDLPTLIKHPIVINLSKKHNKSPAQVLLRYGLQRNIVVIPKSSNPKRMAENVDIFDFKLTETEMNKLKELDQHGQYRKFDFLDIWPEVKHHPEYPFADRISK